MNESNLSSDSSIYSTESTFLTLTVSNTVLCYALYLLHTWFSQWEDTRQPASLQVSYFVFLFFYFFSLFFWCLPDSTFLSESHSIFQRVQNRSKYIVKILHFTLHSDYTKLKQLNISFSSMLSRNRIYSFTVWTSEWNQFYLSGFRIAKNAREYIKKNEVQQQFSKIRKAKKRAHIQNWCVIHTLLFINVFRKSQKK